MEKQSFELGTSYNIKETISVAEGGIVSKQFIKNKGGNNTFMIRTNNSILFMLRSSSGIAGIKFGLRYARTER